MRAAAALRAQLCWCMDRLQGLLHAIIHVRRGIRMDGMHYHVWCEELVPDDEPRVPEGVYG